MKKNFYKGFSTRKWMTDKTFRINDIELVKQDLLNEIHTDKGERIHMPNFGTRIPSITFEPNDPFSLDVIESDLRAVFDNDPRVQLIDLKILALADNNAVVALADLLYVEFEVRDVLNITIDTGS